MATINEQKRKEIFQTVLEAINASESNYPVQGSQNI